MIPFIKAHGTGNDFVIFEADLCPEIIRNPAFIQRVCHRRKGIGGDGVLIISPPRQAGIDFHLDYHNADGSWETFCGNGRRCAVRVFAQRHERSGQITFEAGDGVHTAEAHPDGHVGVQIIAPRHINDMLELHGFQGQQVDSGAPHFVTEVPEATLELATEIGPRIRWADVFLPRGVNVNFFQRLDEHTIRVITYEKGVEDVVLSCASGSTASAYQAARAGNMTSPIRVLNPGGELVVDFDPDWQQVTITGPVVLVYESQLPDDF